jgi:hypothetical protein
MERRIKVSSKPLKVIRVTSQTLKRLDRKHVAEALGAELVETGVPESLLPARTTPRNGNGKSDE